MTFLKFLHLKLLFRKVIIRGFSKILAEFSNSLFEGMFSLTVYSIKVPAITESYTLISLIQDRVENAVAGTSPQRSGKVTSR